MLMAPRKQISTHNGVPSKSKAISVIGGTVPPPPVDQHTTQDTCSSSPQGAAANVQAPPPQYKDQILHMLADMKKQMKQQASQIVIESRWLSTTRMPSVNRRR